MTFLKQKIHGFHHFLTMTPPANLRPHFPPDFPPRWHFRFHSDFPLESPARTLKQTASPLQPAPEATFSIFSYEFLPFRLSLSLSEPCRFVRSGAWFSGAEPALFYIWLVFYVFLTLLYCTYFLCIFFTCAHTALLWFSHARNPHIPAFLPASSCPDPS